MQARFIVKYGPGSRLLITGRAGREGGGAGCRAHTTTPSSTISQHPADNKNLFSQQYECPPRQRPPYQQRNLHDRSLLTIPSQHLYMTGRKKWI